MARCIDGCGQAQKRPNAYDLRGVTGAIIDDIDDRLLQHA